MDRLDYEFFLDLLKTNGSWLDETHFYFADDPKKTERWLGFLPKFDRPYWIGGCDIPDGASYRTAEELLEAPVFDGMSLQARWTQVRILGAMGVGLEGWKELYAEHGNGPSPRSGPVVIWKQ